MVVIVVVMSDLLFFLHENNQKFYFVAPDSNKVSLCEEENFFLKTLFSIQAEAIPLSKLLVREKAGHEKSIYVLISSNHAEMFELECIHPVNRKSWLDSIREAVDQSPDDELGLRRLNDSGASGGTADRTHELISKYSLLFLLD